MTSKITLHQGDCLEYLKTLAPGSVDAVVTSPPYWNQRKYSGQGHDWDTTLDALLDFPCSSTCQVFVNLGVIHKSGECFPYWEAWRERMRAGGWRFFGWYVWDQGDGLPGDWKGRLKPSYEFVFHFNRESVTVNRTVKCKQPGRVLSGTGLRKSDNTMPGKFNHAGQPTATHKIPDSVIRVYREQSRKVQHPAKFPVGLPRHLIEAFTQPGYTILDPFMGSGTTGVACVRTGRNFIGCEIDPGYFAIAQKRIADEKAKTVLLNAHPE
jgi:DNA modification methylase